MPFRYVDVTKKREQTKAWTWTCVPCPYDTDTDHR